MYEHIGQHGHGDPASARRPYTRPATPSEYEDLASELRRIGYRLRIIRRIGPHYLELRRAELARIDKIAKGAA